MKNLKYINLQLTIITILFFSLLNLSNNTLAKSANGMSKNQIYDNEKLTITLKVLLVEFKDVKHRNPNYPANLSLPAYTFDDFNNMLFSDEIYVSPNMYSPDGEKVFGSLHDYYKVMSSGKLIIEGYILNKDENNDNVPDWIILDNSKAYYHDSRGTQFKSESKNKAKSLGLNIDTDDYTFLAIIYAGHTYRELGNTLNPAARSDMHEYIMGERFASCSPYDEERNDPSLNRVSTFAHIGIHAHEFCHLLGIPDLVGGFNNQKWCLMSSGNYNGPYNEGACPAPINPYYRWKLGWINLKNIGDSTRIICKYNISNPDIYFLQNNGPPNNYFIVDYREFGSAMRLGKFNIPDYNSYINTGTQTEGILIWRKLKGNFVKLLYSSGKNCTDGGAHIFPGNKNVRVLSPWSDCRKCMPGFFWVPNTLPSNNCGMEIISSEKENYIVDLFQIHPHLTSPSAPRNLSNSQHQNIKLDWDKNMEPDIAYYKIYKKWDGSDYNLFDSIYSNSYTDYSEISDTTIGSLKDVYYKITSVDSQMKESTFSEIIRLKVMENTSTDITIFDRKLNRFNLFQNYPNPFNPSTNLEYIIGEKTRVILKVYDILGKEITTLVNEEQLPGSYGVEFNSTKYNNVASGVYIFKLSASDFNDVKKGVLVK